jgi:hypothetical protein
MMRKINKIVVHCTATRPEWWADKLPIQKVDEVRRWHVEDRGWSDIGYHYLIDRDGSVVEGRPLIRAGAHAKGHNSHSIGISLFGGHGGNVNDAFGDNFTKEQDAALRKLIAKLKDRYAIGSVIGHNEVSNKACPTFEVSKWLLKEPISRSPAIILSKQRDSATQSRTVQASVVQGASAVGGAVAAFQALDGTAQIVALVGCFIFAGLAMFILRERLKAWASGWR